MTPELLIVAAACAVFSCGAVGVVYRKNPIAVLMSVELMINAAILVLILGSRIHGNAEGQAAGLLVLVLGGAEAVVGLALALALFRDQPSVNVDDAREIVG
jgi:NADH-quinone oxidoreductase subunit K